MESHHQDEALGSAAEAKATVLVVDDEEDIRFSVRQALSRRDYRVIEARDLDEAVREFGSADPQVDVVILDMVLPGGGPNIFRALRNVVPDIPVIVSSGNSGRDPGAIAQLQREDRVHVLPKPYELTELYRVVGAALDGR